MTILYVLIPLALVLAAAGVAAFAWAVRNGQFDDVETPALRLLFDEPSAGSGSDAERASTPDA